jgi:hypothetical protein
MAISLVFNYRIKGRLPSLGCLYGSSIMLRYLVIITIFTAGLLNQVPVWAEYVYPTYKNGVIVLPAVDLGGYHASLSMSQMGVGAIGSKYFFINKMTIIEEPQFSARSVLDINSGAIETRGLISNGKQYDMTLSMTDDGRFQVSRLTEGGLVSLLYLVTANSAQVSDGATYGKRTVGKHITLQVDANVSEFSDRPYRIARPFEGGLGAFVSFYRGSDFETDPPNATFVGTDPQTGQEVYTIFEIDDIYIHEDQVVVSVLGTLGNAPFPAQSQYINTSIIIDDFWSNVADLAEKGAQYVCKTGVEALFDYLGDSTSQATATQDGCDKVVTVFSAACNSLLDLSTPFGLGPAVCSGSGRIISRYCEAGGLDKVEAIALDICSL